MQSTILVQKNRTEIADESMTEVKRKGTRCDSLTENNYAKNSVRKPCHFSDYIGSIKVIITILLWTANLHRWSWAKLLMGE